MDLRCLMKSYSGPGGIQARNGDVITCSDAEGQRLMRDYPDGWQEQTTSPGQSSEMAAEAQDDDAQREARGQASYETVELTDYDTKPAEPTSRGRRRRE